MVKGSLKEKALQRKLGKAAESPPYENDPSIASKKQGKKFEESIAEHIETPDFEYAKATIENGVEVSQFIQNNYPVETSVPAQKKTIEAQFDNLIDQYGNQKIKDMETTGFTNKGVHEYANIMQKTNSDKFTSMKKQGSVHSKINKFSSSGVGNFQIVGSANAGLPPFSPTPMTV